MVVFPYNFMPLVGPIPTDARPLKVFEEDRRKKLLALADYLLRNNPVESTYRTVKFLLKIASREHEAEELPELPWISSPARSDLDRLSEFDVNSCPAFRRLLPQMRFSARLARNR